MKTKKNINKALKAISLTSLIAMPCLSAFAMQPAPSQTEEGSCDKVSKVLAVYTNNVVIAGYTQLSDAALKLNSAVKKFVSNPTDENAAAAAQAWLNLRVPLEQGEAYLYGPANFTALDPHLDSWPVDTVQLESFLKAVNDGTIKVDAGYVRDGLGSSLRGTHALGYLLFRDGQPRKAKDFTKAELEYLLAATQVATEDCILYLAEWAGMDSLSKDKKAVLEEAELESTGVYGDEMKNAGKAGSRYPTQADALEEIFQAMIGIAEELGVAKFGEPFEAQDPKLFESWYSLTSLVDCKNNFQSIINAYNGVNSDENSISALVSAKDNKADENVKIAFVKVAKSMDAFNGKPLAKSLDNKAAFKEVIESCKELTEALEKASEVVLNK